ncbi:MAG TPA: tetratricopeptide repeat protein [Herpetosiphonaceae bacterium]
MNTIFKFGFQVWVLWALAAALLLPYFLRRLRRWHPVLQGAGSAMVIVAVLPTLVFPIAGTISRIGTRFPVPPAGLTLDGLAFMETASYGYRDQQVNLAGDLAAIRWLQANVAGNPTVLQSEEEFYRAYGVRIAANTGLPTIVGALHAGEMRPGEPVNQRVNDAQRIYSTSDVSEAQWLLNKYGVDYVYVGQLERLRDPLGAQKFAGMGGLAPVYNQQNVQIYKVTPDMAGFAIQWRPNVAPPPAQEFDELGLAQANYLAAPDNAGYAFEYGRLLWRGGRAPEAVVVLADATERHPQDVAMRHALGDVLVDSGRFDEGIERYKQAYDLAPSPENKVKLGTGYLAWARLDNSKLALAEQSFREAAEERPDLAEAHYHLGNIYGQLGQAEDARREYQRYLEVAPADAGWRPEVEKKLAEMGG